LQFSGSIVQEIAAVAEAASRKNGAIQEEVAENPLKSI
jgi:hypothetical protein